MIDNVAGCNTVAELKKLLKTRGLKVAGKKRELAERLVRNDEADMERLHRDKAIVTCSARIRALASQYLAEKAKDHDDTIAAAITALRAPNLSLASQTMAAHRGRQLKLQAPNPLTIEGPPRSTDDDVKALEIIFGLKPKILGDLSARDWDTIHAVAGVNHLLGGALSADWLPSEIGDHSKLDRKTVLPMMSFAFLHHRNVRRLREIDVKQAIFVCVNAGSCAACLKMTDTVFPLDNFPALPYENCDRTRRACALGPVSRIPVAGHMSDPAEIPKKHLRRRSGTATWHMARAAVDLPLDDLYRMDDAACWEFFVATRFGSKDTVRCPYCGSIGRHKLRLKDNRRWKCHGCRSTFSVTTGTIFDRQRLALRELLIGALTWINSSAGQPALELKRHIDKSYNTTFTLQHKLRESLVRGYNVGLLNGDIEIDGAHQSGYRADEKRGKPQGGIANTAAMTVDELKAKAKLMTGVA